MSKPSMNVLRGLRSTLNADGPTDADLLNRYVSERDPAAFELLVWRYAGLVLNVARAVTKDHHTAEDATQATFLAFARKAASVHRGEAVPAWLTKVARRVAVRAAKRLQPSMSAGLETLPARLELPNSGEESFILHDELARLPDRFRVPILLCYFDGLTQEEAARRLGWPVGTVASRISRAKDRLQNRLTRRGVLVPTAGIVALLTTDNVASASSRFVSATSHAATAFAGGQENLGTSTTVIELAHGALRTMTISKLQWTAGLVAACGMVLTFGGVWAAGQGAGAAPTPDPTLVVVAQVKPKPAEKPAEEPAKPVNTSSLHRQRSLNNLKQLMLAIQNYEAVYGRLPCDIRDKDGKPLLSWRVAILPFIEQAAFYNRFKLDEPWDSEHNIQFSKIVVKLYASGVTPAGSSHTYYQVFAGPGTAFDPASVEKVAAGAPGNYYRSKFNLAAAIPDGTSNTLGIVEAGPPVVWTKPADLPFDVKKPLPKMEGPYANALHVVACDGAAYSLKRDIDAEVLKNLIGRDDGNVTPAFKELAARSPADTPEEKAELKKMLDENEALLGKVEKLIKEHNDLLKLRNSVIKDLGSAEEQQEGLKRMIESLQAMNKHIRDDLGLHKNAPIPMKPAKPEK